MRSSPVEPRRSWLLCGHEIGSMSSNSTAVSGARWEPSRSSSTLAAGGVTHSPWVVLGPALPSLPNRRASMRSHDRRRNRPRDRRRVPCWRHRRTHHAAPATDVRRGAGSGRRVGVGRREPVAAASSSRREHETLLGLRLGVGSIARIAHPEATVLHRPGLPGVPSLEDSVLDRVKPDVDPRLVELVNELPPDDRKIAMLKIASGCAWVAAATICEQPVSRGETVRRRLYSPPRRARAHGGRITERNRCCSPVSGSTRRSSGPRRADLHRARRWSAPPAARGHRCAPPADVSARRPRRRTGQCTPRPARPRPASAGRPHARSPISSQGQAGEQ